MLFEQPPSSTPLVIESAQIFPGDRHGVFHLVCKWTYLSTLCQMICFYRRSIYIHFCTLYEINTSILGSQLLDPNANKNNKWKQLMNKTRQVHFTIKWRFKYHYAHEQKWTYRYMESKTVTWVLGDWVYINIWIEIWSLLFKEYNNGLYTVRIIHMSYMSNAKHLPALMIDARRQTHVCLPK